MIIFKKVRWKNFLSTGNYFTEIDLNKNTNTLIVGENGSGKSTLLDAICFALFGKPFRKVNKAQLINSINGKDCLVEVEFDIGNKAYQVSRGIKPNVFEIRCNNELINQEASAKDYQTYLEKFVLKLNYKSFTQIVILGSASFTPFMQLDTSDRRIIIEDLLDIQIFSTMNSIVKERVSINKDLITEKKHNIELNQQKKKILLKHLEDMKKNNDEEIKKYVEEIQDNNNTVSELLSKNTRLREYFEKTQNEVKDKDDIEIKIKKMSKLESQIEGNLSKIKDDICFYEQHGDCPTCRQTIPDEFKETQLTSLETKSFEFKNGLQKLEEKIKEHNEKLSFINEKYKLLQEINIKIATNNTTINEINKYIIKLQNKIEQLNVVKNSSNKENEDLQSLEDEYKILSDELKLLIEEKSYLELSSNLLKDSGIKTRIVKQYLPIINKLVNKYLASLDFFVNFNLDESFKETIKSRHRDEFSYNNFSEGEKQRIDMALILTWRSVAKLKNSVNTNLLILDETFDSSLDTNGTEYLMNMLHMLDGVNLFVISHKGDILQEKFSDTIRFKKEKNFSKIYT